MPVSKNRRKSKKAQRRKVSRAKAESSPGWDGVPDPSDSPALPTPLTHSRSFGRWKSAQAETPGTGRFR